MIFILKRFFYKTRKYLVISVFLLALSMRLTSFSAFAVMVEASDITSQASFSTHDSHITDGDESTSANIGEFESVIITSNIQMAGIYIRFDRADTWYLICNKEERLCGNNGFLHEYIDLSELFDCEPNEVELLFPNGAVIAEITLFSSGKTPGYVQRWDSPDRPADLLLISTHSDDEHLFFAGVLPYYAGELKYEVQVAYFTNHNATPARNHELLNGLWTAGVTRYPVIYDLPDAWNGSSYGLEYGYSCARSYGFTKEMLIRRQVETIRRFKPQVVLAHDVNGEYGHPQHAINTDTLRAALEISQNHEIYPDIANKYGVWEVPKTYIHLWPENCIIMDWDKPLRSFDGKSAYDVSKLGFACHHSQNWTWFNLWLNGKNSEITKASQITDYSPCKWGLYKSSVGRDVIGGDFFENLTVRSASKSPDDTGEIGSTNQVSPSKTSQDQTQDTETEFLHTSGAFIIFALFAPFSALTLSIARRRK